MIEFPWFESVDPNELLQQGDILLKFPAIRPTGLASAPTDETPSVVPAQIYECDLIVLSQSCDIAGGKIELVLGCPLYPLEDLRVERARKEKYYELGETLRKRKEPAFCLLNKCELPGWDEKDYLVANFKILLSVPLDDARSFAQKGPARPRLRPPFREHLAHSFAHFVSRVGFPQGSDLPRFDKKSGPPT